MNNCHCNICLRPMESTKTRDRNHFCCDQCRTMNKLPKQDGKALARFDSFAPRVSCGPALAMDKRYAVSRPEYVSNRILRVKGQGSKQRITTKG